MSVLIGSQESRGLANQIISRVGARRCLRMFRFYSSIGLLAACPLYLVRFTGDKKPYILLHKGKILRTDTSCDLQAGLDLLQASPPPPEVFDNAYQYLVKNHDTQSEALLFTDYKPVDESNFADPNGAFTLVPLPNGENDVMTEDVRDLTARFGYSIQETMNHRTLLTPRNYPETTETDTAGYSGIPNVLGFS